MIEVKLIEPINDSVAEYQLYKTAYAAGICTDTHIDPSDAVKHRKLITSLVNNKHTSVLEHIVYTFEISNITRALLQELSRHRMTSPTVQSTRWALKKMNKNISNIEEIAHIPECLTESDKERYVFCISEMLKLRSEFTEAYSNDVAKYLTPECIYTKEMLTINARSLLNLFELRTSARALDEFRRLCHKMYFSLPYSHRFIYSNIFNDPLVQKFSI